MMQHETVRVLLIEDNPGDARLVEILLSEAGLSPSFEVTHTERLGEALERLDRSVFDVILLDLSLPDSSGLETVDQMRMASPRTPVVVLSGQDDEETALQALQCGAEDYLVKGRGDGELIARSIRYAIERKKAEEKLAYLAQYDPLTDLANRALFQDRLGQALARTEREGNMVALMFLDLDHFKAVNDKLGHNGGDELLKEVAGRIKRRVRESDTVARIGGDEFAIILEDLSDAQDAAPVAQDILDRLSEPLVLDGYEIPLTASIGIAIRPPSEGDRLLKDADTAMYRAKERGRNTYEFYTEEMNVQAFELLTLRNMLRHALGREEFLLYYQPQVELATHEIVGAEALLRWQRPDLGLVSPMKFIPVLEDTGDITRVGEWVLRTACRQGKAWQDSGLGPLKVAVNLSTRQFSQRNLVDTVAGILEETGLDPYYLELEVTESLLMEDIEASSRMLNELKTIVGGLRVSIDDFGTGHSSLYYLKSFPIDLLKIDQSFVRDVATDPDDAAITAAIIQLAHDLRLKVIAEGVETEEQLAYLRKRGCDEAQGFYFGRPLPVDEFARLLESGEPLLGAST
jgi:diguanylate cyclase (GGDEF)-like protein